MKDFFRYKLNIKIFFAFLFIIIIPALSSFWMTHFILQKTIQKEIESRLFEGLSAYFRELEIIEEKCLNIARSFSEKKVIIDKLRFGQYSALEKDLTDFYNMNIVDIIEIENPYGKVVLRGHNPALAGDIKIEQDVIQEGLQGKVSLSYEPGKSGFAVRAVAPIKYDNKIIGLFMTGSLFSKDFANHLESLTALENGIYRDGKKIVSTYEGLNVLTSETLAGLKKGETILEKHEKINSGKYYTILKPIFIRGKYWGAVCLGMSMKDGEKYFNYSKNQLSYIIFWGLVIAVLVYIFLANNINLSLRKIITGINNLSFDQYNQDIVIKRSDEFGKIAESFNSLVHRLNLYNKRIKKLQEDLIKSTQLATAGQISAGLAHEIRNPLSSMKMMAQIVKSRFLQKGPGSEELDIILKEIDRINNKVNELLEFAKPSKMKFSKSDIHLILDEILSLCVYKANHQGISIDTDFDNSIPFLYIDVEKLRICFFNVVLNAIQAMPEGGFLKISSRKTDDKIIIRICNTGNVFDIENKEKIFEPFFTTKKDGAGLGLALSKLITERHYGVIDVNVEGSYTCFSFIFPVNLEDKESVKNGFDIGS